ncbi:MAG: phage holin family protein [Proteobacteria bacterium]|nr:phage holin family protein [Pseudomonadota bacterium]
MTDTPAMTQAEPEPAPAAARRGLLAATLEALRTRLDLAAVELEIQVLLLIRLLAWLFAAVICVLLGVAFGIVALIVALWDTHRTLGLLVGGGSFLVLAVLLAWLGLRSMRGRPGPFADSLAQLQADERRAGGET